MKEEPFAPLDPGLYREVVRRALAEDLRWGDITTEAAVPAEARATGDVQTNMECVLAGIDIGLEVFLQLDPKAEVTRARQDGETCEAGETVLRLSGFASALLTAERTALNFLQRLSGIATLTRRFVDAAGARTTILDTRKTTPTLRMLEKYAVRAGGAVNHRLALDDGLLIKENHVRVAGSIATAVERLRATDYDFPIEVEAHSLDEVDQALDAGATIVLLDNLSPDQRRAAVERCRGRAKTEVSGGVTLADIDTIAALSPDYVSVGALTHSAPAVDMSFEIVVED